MSRADAIAAERSIERPQPLRQAVMRLVIRVQAREFFAVGRTRAAWMLRTPTPGMGMRV